MMPDELGNFSITTLVEKVGAKKGEIGSGTTFFGYRVFLIV
jgi:hypothetical protein